MSIAGLDPSGGAGLAADLRGFRAAGVWGAAACAVVTVQSTVHMTEAHAIEGRTVRAQAEEVLRDLDVRAMKAGALGSEENVRVVGELFAEHREIPAIVDPVGAPSRAKSGGARLDGGASNQFWMGLLRAAALITPNADEAGALLGRSVRTEAEGRRAAEELVSAGARAVLVKGGHLRGDAESDGGEGRDERAGAARGERGRGDDGEGRAVDWFATERGTVAIVKKRLAVPEVHGTGCTLSALIAGRLAARREGGAVTDEELLEAVRWARDVLERALMKAAIVGRGARVLELPVARLEVAEAVGPAGAESVR